MLEFVLLFIIGAVVSRFVFHRSGGIIGNIIIGIASIIISVFVFIIRSIFESTFG